MGSSSTPTLPQGATGAHDSSDAANEKPAELPPLPISPDLPPVIGGLEEALDDLPIVLITNYQPQGTKREDLLNILAEWAAKLVEDKVLSFLGLSRLYASSS